METTSSAPLATITSIRTSHGPSERPSGGLSDGHAAVEGISLTARIDQLQLQFGSDVAQFYLASGDPAGTATETSFATLAKAIRARATALAALGISRADRVSLMTPQGLNSYATLIGTMIAAT